MTLSTEIRRAAVCVFTAAALLTGGLTAGAEEVKRCYIDDEDFIRIADGARVWEKHRTSGDSLADGFIADGTAGSSEADWFIIAEKTLGLEDDYESYLDAAKAPGEEELLTEPARRSVTTALLGGSGEDMSGAALDEAGCNELIWVALAQRLNGYDGTAAMELLYEMQQPDGGFGLKGSDPDVTAMALTVLDGEPAKQAADWLCENYSPADMTCETAAWYMIGACCSGDGELMELISAKEGTRPIDVLMSCRNDDGGFAHTPGSESGVLPTSQALTALAALAEFNAGGGSIYDGEPAEVDLYKQHNIAIESEETIRLHAEALEITNEIRAGYYPPKSVEIVDLPNLIDLNNRIEKYESAGISIIAADDLRERERTLKFWALAGGIFGVLWKVGAVVLLIWLRRSGLAAKIPIVGKYLMPKEKGTGFFAKWMKKLKRSTKK